MGEGVDSVFGLKETVKVTVKSFDSTTSKGTIDITATGIIPKACTNRPITKTGQDIKVDLTGCDIDITVKALTYCSDQDNFFADFTPHTNPPLPLPEIKVTASPVACSSVEVA